MVKSPKKPESIYDRINAITKKLKKEAKGVYKPKVTSPGQLSSSGLDGSYYLEN